MLLETLIQKMDLQWKGVTSHILVEIGEVRIVDYFFIVDRQIEHSTELRGESRLTSADNAADPDKQILGRHLTTC